MTEIKNRHLPEQGKIDRTKIEGYSLRSGAFYSWLKESGYTVSQIAERLDIDEKEFVHTKGYTKYTCNLCGDIIRVPCMQTRRCI